MQCSAVTLSASLPHELVVDNDGEDEVDSKEPEEEAGDPAGELVEGLVEARLGDDVALPGAAPGRRRGSWRPPPPAWARAS